jgi:AraC family transcriptional regulator
MEAPLVPSTQGHDLYEFAAGGFHYRVTEYRGGLALPNHRHEHAKMSTAIRGGYTESFAGAGRFECDGRTLLMKPPDVGHTDHYLANTLCLTVDLAPHALDLVRSFSPLFGKVKETRLRSPIIPRIMSELQSPDSVSGLVLEALALELISVVARRDTPRSDSATVFARACEFLDAHLASPLRMADVANAAHTHPAQLARVFRTHAACSPGQWLRARRVEIAKTLLRGGEAPIAAIALQLGYYDQSHFTNAFRREVGVAPAEFRRAT